MAENTIHQVKQVAEVLQPISKQAAMRLTAEELRFITVRRTLTDHGQDLLMNLAKNFKRGQDQRGETASSRPRAVKRPKASSLRLVPRS